MPITLNPDPASTIGASEEYKAAWFAVYGYTGTIGTAPTSIGQIAGLQSALDMKASNVHSHGISDVTGLQAAIDAKSPLSHLHTSAQISDFTEAAQDAVAAMLQGASGVTVSYNDSGNIFTISGSGSGGADAETIRDTMGVTLIGIGNISVTPNDAADTITVSTTATANSTDATLLNRANHTGTQPISTVSGLQAALDSKMSSSATISTTPASTISIQPSFADGTVFKILDKAGGGSLRNLFEIKDYLDQPIFAVGNDGGAHVLGDRMGVHSGNDIWNASVDMMPWGGLKFRGGDSTGGDVIVYYGKGAPLPSHLVTAMQYENQARGNILRAYGRVSDIYVDGATGTTYRCTAAGTLASPAGTWAAVSGGGGGAVSSVAGRTGAVVLTKTDVGLGNVDNTNDLNKPISTATQTALNAKADTVHTHTASQVSDASSIGRSVLTAADAPAIRSTIGVVEGLTLLQGAYILLTPNPTAKTLQIDSLRQPFWVELNGTSMQIQTPPATERETPATGTVRNRAMANLTGMTTVRLSTNLTANSTVAGLKLILQWSTDQTTWNTFAGAEIALNASVGRLWESSDVAIPAGAKSRVCLRLATIGGDGTTSPTISQTRVEVK